MSNGGRQVQQYLINTNPLPRNQIELRICREKQDELELIPF